MGFAALGLLTVGSCRREADQPLPDGRINLGSGDTGALNFAYAMEQIETAFFKQLSNSFYTGIKASEQVMLLEIQGHDQAHASLLQAALGPDAIGKLNMDFSGIDFSNRDGALSAARSIKDLMVSAYNGLAVYFSDATRLGFIGKIASVEARHAAMIRELLQPLSFADTSILNPISRIDEARSPQDVLTLAHPYIRETLNADQLRIA